MGNLDVQETPACAWGRSLSYWWLTGRGFGMRKTGGCSRYWITGRGAGKTEDGVWRVTRCGQRLMDATVTRMFNTDRIPLQNDPL